MKHRHKLAGICAVLLAVACPLQASHANTTCKSVPGIADAIEAFLQRVADAQAIGAGSLTVKDVLIGVTEIAPVDELALAARDRVQLTRHGASDGEFSNSGPRPIEFSGIFAATTMFFRIPSLVKGNYFWSRQEVTFRYDPQHTIELGENFLGVAFFRAIDHSVVSHDRLSFYFKSNTGGDPDRCYVIARG